MNSGWLRVVTYAWSRDGHEIITFQSRTWNYVKYLVYPCNAGDRSSRNRTRMFPFGLAGLTPTPSSWKMNGFTDLHTLPSQLLRAITLFHWETSQHQIEEECQLKDLPRTSPSVVERSVHAVIVSNGSGSLPISKCSALPFHLHNELMPTR